jgi:hypothetical protein
MTALWRTRKSDSAPPAPDQDERFVDNSIARFRRPGV